MKKPVLGEACFRFVSEGSGSEKLRGYMAVVEACHFHLSNNVDRVHVGNLCGEQLQAHLESRCDAF